MTLSTSYRECDWAVSPPKLGTERAVEYNFKWIRANGGEWTHFAADRAAGNGHLETLEWIRSNGGEWSYSAANSAAESGYLETLQWMKENGAPISAKYPLFACKSVLDYCVRIGIYWDNINQVRIELDHVTRMYLCRDLRCMIGDYVSIAQ